MWDHSLQTYRDMLVGEGWENKKSFDVQKIQDATFKVSSDICHHIRADICIVCADRSRDMLVWI